MASVKPSKLEATSPAMSRRVARVQTRGQWSTRGLCEVHAHAGVLGVFMKLRVDCLVLLVVSGTSFDVSLAAVIEAFQAS